MCFVKQGIRCLAAAACIGSALADLDVYVSAGAKAGGMDRRRQHFRPCRRLAMAVELRGSLVKSKASDAVTIYIAPGEYHLQKTFELIARDGGTEKAPVIYRAEKPGTVSIPWWHHAQGFGIHQA